jgi:hypothetical protein
MYPGGEAIGTSKREIAERNDRQTIDLTDSSTRHIDHQGALLDLFVNLFPHPIGAMNLGIDRLLHMLASDDILAIDASPIVCLA